MKPEIIQFDVYGLFNEFKHHHLDFQSNVTLVDEARIVIITGRNGSGKTTILNMIDGILNLDFNLFREVPFKKASLKLSSGDKLSVENEESCLLVRFGDLAAKLNKKMPGPIDGSEEEIFNVTKFRSAALPILREVSFEKVDIHRSSFLRKQVDDNRQVMIEEDGTRTIINRKPVGKLRARLDEKSVLSTRVRNFVREAQVDYKKYFSSEGADLFPKILKRLKNPGSAISSTMDLIYRLETIKSNEDEMSRFGLTMNISDIDQLTDLLKDEGTISENEAVNAALGAYVETLETKNEERKLISSRLRKFEKLIGKFLVKKTVQIDYSKGLKIITSSGAEISELELSSGEYHLLYMMVTALVSTRTGTAIAIDEPELSLHLTWQRELIRTLVGCSFGASPLFVFATHSSSIASEFSDKCIDLG